MPINATIDYFKAEDKFSKAKTREEKILALEEMIRELPKHKGTENVLAQLKSKLSKLKEQSSSKKSGSKKDTIKKEGYAQVCILSMPNIGKSTLMNNITNAKPKISEHPYTTFKPELGALDYQGINIQTIEIPSSFEPEFMSICRTANLVVLLYKNKEDLSEIKQICKDRFIHTKKISIQRNTEPDKIKEKVWESLGLIIVYTRDRMKKKADKPMALKKTATIEEFAKNIHKDFVKNFRFAKIWRKENKKTLEKQVGLKYQLKNNDIVEVYTK